MLACAPQPIHGFPALPAMIRRRSPLPTCCCCEHAETNWEKEPITISAKPMTTVPVTDAAASGDGARVILVYAG
jgi:hypothetical protein